MGKIASHGSGIFVDEFDWSTFLTAYTVGLDQETPEVTALGSTGPERVVGNYDWGVELAGNFDGAASQGDATLFAMIGLTGGGGSGGARAVTFDPTGNVAGPDDPNYDGNAVLSSLSITAALGAPVTYAATLLGDGALARVVA